MAEETIEERVAKSETKIESLENFVGELRVDIKEIKDKLLSRPSWPVSIIITIFSIAT